MIRRSLKDLSQMISNTNDIKKYENISINGVCIDTRKIEKGNLFVPFKGQNHDGHQFVEAAIEQGAAATLWQSDVPNPPEDLPIIIVDDTLEALQQLARAYLNQVKPKVIGITGSNGKTTTKDMVTSLLSLKYKVQKTEGNYNNHIGLPLTILQLREDTEIAVLEMGMSGRGEIDLLSKLATPDAVIITNIGEAHLLDLGSREGIAEAKLEIINGLKDDGFIVYYGDEPLLRNALAGLKDKQTQTFGKSEPNTLYPIEIKSVDSGSLFKVNKSEEEFYLPVLGYHNIMNALSAMLIANHFGIPFSELNLGFKNLKLTNMRMELIEGKNGVKIINDAYNASPTAMRAAIDLVSNLEGYEQKILVLGDMLELGPDEIEYHYQVGELIHQDKIDVLFTYGKLAGNIAKGAKLPSDRIYSFLDKKELINEMKKYINPNTLVLVKASRGMKLEEVVKEIQ